ncbi:MAG: LysM peptidoglycan-binding domain-containing protein [Chloroflexota bacterium]
MIPSKPPMSENESSASLQRVGIAVGTLIIVTLTVVAALFLAMQDLTESPTPVAGQVSPTSTPPAAVTLTATTLPSPATVVVSTATPSATPTAPPPPPTSTPTPSPSPTQTPPPPTPLAATSTPVVIVVTPTPPLAPAAVTPGACQPPPSWTAYTVQPGDTLNSLASRTGTSVFELQQVNCLASFTLQSGQTIYLPFTPPTPTVTFTPRPTERPGPTPTRTPTAIAPQIDSVAPSRVDNRQADEDILLTVVGRNFRPNEVGFKAELTGPQDVLLQLGETRSSTSFQAIAPAGLPTGTYAMVVTNPDDRVGIRQSAFTIGAASPTDTPAPAPDIVRFTPTSGRISEEILLTVQGRDFQPEHSNFKVELQATDGSLRVELDLGTIRTDTNFEAIIRAGVLPAGNYNLIVTNPDGRNDIASDQYRAIE